VKRAAVALAAGASVLACDPIVAQPLSEAPSNVCSQFACEGYEGGTSTAPRCVRDRCEIPGAGGRPEYPFWIVVHAAETSFFAPGSTYVFFSDERGEPAFKPATPGTRVTACNPSQRCLTLPGLAAVRGSYKVLPDTFIPVRVTYEQLGNSQQAIFPSLPLNPLFGSTQLLGATATTTGSAQFLRAVPFGLYRRTLVPEPPFDALYPPAETLDPQKIEAGTFDDPFELKVDDPNGDSRLATVAREDGLDGWRLSLVDATSKHRISVLKTLAGKSITTRLDTTGANRSQLSTGLRDNVEAVLEPPSSWIAIPRFVTPLFGGAGLRNIVYPPLPPPVRVSGVVAQPGDSGTLLGYPARIRFESEILSTRTDPNPLLQYATDLSTDERGRFSTILPPGSYTAIVEPDVGTGFAKTRIPVSVDRTVTALTLRPPPRAIVSGRVVLTDRRPLAEAEVLALPVSSPEAPRPERTRTSRDGRFALELDRGPYTLTVVPRPGTGFPRVAVSQEVGSSNLELSDIRVPVPTVLTLTLFDASGLNPIVRSMVRIFARPGGSTTRDPIEIGNGMTDATGAVEILLAGEPR
jgi:hypothetical protein